MATMENVYDPEKIPWASSIVRDLPEEHAILRSKLRKVFKFRESSTAPPAAVSEIRNLAETIDVEPDRVRTVLSLCSSSALGGRYGLLPETEPILYKSFEAEGDNGLETLRVRAAVEEARKNDERFRFDMFENRRYKRHEVGDVADLKNPASVKEREERVSDDVVRKEHEEIVVHVKFYDVAKPELTPNILVPRKQRIERCKEELIFLGSQPLSALHDALKCPRKELVNIDYSSDPRVFNAKEHAAKLAEHNADAVLFVHDTLYASSDNALEVYVQPIQTWAMKNADKINPSGEAQEPSMTLTGELSGIMDMKLFDDPEKKTASFKEAMMSKTTFAQLKLRIGFPYVYIHDSSCHHVIIFSWARLFNKIDDWKFRMDYPVRRRYRKVARKMCQICLRQTAVWLVTDHPDLPEEVNPFCDTCLYSVLYDVTRHRIGQSNKFRIRVEKKGNFKVYHA